MDFFRKRKREVTQFEQDVTMAREIVNTLGINKTVHSWSLALAGGTYNERTYQGYGLKIVNSEYEGFYICFNGKIVLGISYTNERSRRTKEYYPGAWEEVLVELYDKVPELSNIKMREEAQIQRSLDTLEMIKSLTSGSINNRLYVEAKNTYYGMDNDMYDGTSYRVYYDGKIVFRGYYSAYNKRVDIFEQGEWVNQVKDYLNELYQQQQEREEEQDIKIAKEQIKILRLIKK